MKRIFAVGAALVLLAGTSSAGTKQKWTAGWDNFDAPLNYSKSSVSWSVGAAKKTITVKATLVGGIPDNLYQVALNFFCTTFPADFGQFPNDLSGGGACTPLTRQGVTENSAEVELGVVLTDMNGDGSFSVVIGPVASGTYNLEFFVRNGVGCDYIGGAPCENPYSPSDYQSGSTFGDATTITVP
ncbi:MAG: hypothetical protein WCB53_04855 [Terriglobales bacterium]